jgi:hypothetical protein
MSDRSDAAVTPRVRSCRGFGLALERDQRHDEYRSAQQQRSKGPAAPPNRGPQDSTLLVGLPSLPRGLIPSGATRTGQDGRSRLLQAGLRMRPTVALEPKRKSTAEKRPTAGG